MCCVTVGNISGETRVIENRRKKKNTVILRWWMYNYDNSIWNISISITWNTQSTFGSNLFYFVNLIMEQAESTFRFVYSSSLDHKVTIKMWVRQEILLFKFYFPYYFHFSGTLEGLKHKPNYEKLLENPLLRFSGLYLEQCPPLLVRLQLFNNGESIGLPVTTAYKAFTKRYK